jgi:17 kDa outer membrane surface antigen
MLESSLAACAAALSARRSTKRTRPTSSRRCSTPRETAPNNPSLPWQNAQSGHRGVINFVRIHQEPTGQYCREFQQSIVGGETQNVFGKACGQPDDSWNIAG